MKKAFTLAEVLLTLAIIGVVAALTIPAVITRATHDQYVVGLKKAHNTLKSVEMETVQKNGPIKSWDWTGNSKTSFEKYFKPHFDIVKDCGTGTDDGCFHKENEWKALNGTVRADTYNTASYYRFITSDGMAFAYYQATLSPPSRVAFFAVDVNGKKEPNTIGRDIFTFNFFPTKGIKPGGTYLNGSENESYTQSQIETLTDRGCNTSCTGTNCGWYCAGKVLSEEAMNY